MPTHEFPRLTGNYRRERSAALEVNLLACRMQNRRQTAAPGAPSNIFHSYLHFIVKVSFSPSSSRGLWAPLSLMPGIPYMCTRTHTHIRGFILIWHEKYLEKIRKMLDYGIFICSFNKYFLYICFIFHVQNVSFDLRDVNVEKCEDLK